MKSLTHRLAAFIVATVATGALVIGVMPNAYAFDANSLYVTTSITIPYQEVEAGKSIKKTWFRAESNSPSKVVLSLSSNLASLKIDRQSSNLVGFSATVPANAPRGLYTIAATAYAGKKKSSTNAYVKVIDPKVPPRDANQVSASNFQTCVATPNGKAKCWGRNLNGQTGAPLSQHITAKPYTVPGLSGVKDVSTGNLFSCALKSDNSVWCWGNNDQAQLGNNSLASSIRPVRVHNIPKYPSITAITSGPAHSCAINSAGNVYCWGWNNVGQLGNGSSGFTMKTAVRVSLPSKAKQVSVGGAHSCALLTNGKVYCWGHNDQDQLGFASLKKVYPSPTKIGGSDSYKSIAAGYTFTCGVTTGNVVKCWGSNNHGQSGTGKRPTANSRISPPTQVKGVSGVTKLEAGYYHACAVTSSKALYCWGLSTHSQIPNVRATTYSTATNTYVGTRYGTIDSMALGANHSCMLNTAGKVYCWGNKSFGQLGDGTKLEVQSGEMLTTNKPHKVTF